jgi:hypothetical protein
MCGRETYYEGNHVTIKIHILLSKVEMFVSPGYSTVLNIGPLWWLKIVIPVLIPNVPTAFVYCHYTALCWFPFTHKKSFSTHNLTLISWTYRSVTLFKLYFSFFFYERLILIFLLLLASLFHTLCQNMPQRYSVGFMVIFLCGPQSSVLYFLRMLFWRKTRMMQLILCLP